MANVGGLSVHVARRLRGRSSWRSSRRPALGDAALSAESEEYYFEDCDPNWVCSSAGGVGGAVGRAARSRFAPDMTRANVDAWGAALGAQIDAAYAADSPTAVGARHAPDGGRCSTAQAAADAIAAGATGDSRSSGRRRLRRPADAGLRDGGRRVAPHGVAASRAERSTRRSSISTPTRAPRGRLDASTASQPVDLGVDGIQSSTRHGTGPYGGAAVRTDRRRERDARRDRGRDSSWTVDADRAGAGRAAASGWR